MLVLSARRQPAINFGFRLEEGCALAVSLLELAEEISSRFSCEQSGLETNTSEDLARRRR